MALTHLSFDFSFFFLFPREVSPSPVGGVRFFLSPPTSFVVTPLISSFSVDSTKTALFFLRGLSLAPLSYGDISFLFFLRIKVPHSLSRRPCCFLLIQPLVDDDSFFF